MNDKNRILALYKYLIEESDEKHPVSTEDILLYFEEHDCKVCCKDTIYRYIKQLKDNELLNVDIVSTKGRNAKYYVKNRLLEKDELRLIVDAVNASNFIEESVSKEMLSKLKSIVSKYDAEELNRNILGISNTKAENKKILENVNMIHRALSSNKQIKFDYYRWNSNGKLEKTNKEDRIFNPWALIWANDRYYLYGYDASKELKERCYRVDKISNIRIVEKRRQGEEKFRWFDANKFVSQHLGMYIGEEKYIAIEIPNSLIGAVIDQFGKKEVTINQISKDKVHITFKAANSPLLLGWLVGLEDVKIVKPDDVRQDYIKLLEKNLNCNK